MAWSAATLSVWGKTEPATQSWLPLVRHLQDAAAMAGYLDDHFLPRATRQLLCDLLDASDAEVRALVCWLAGVHDLGKATREFSAQARAIMPAVVGRMREYGLSTDPVTDPVGHPALGQLIVTDWLKERGADHRTATSYACVIGGHHGRNPTDTDLRTASRRPENLGAGAWIEVRRELLDQVAHHTGAEAYLDRWTKRKLPVPAQDLLTGVVIMADWMASDQGLFPYRDAAAAGERLRRAADDLSLPPPWSPTLPAPDATAFLQDRFPALAGRPARGLQQALVELAHSSPGPGLIIVEALMGAGKTEAALLAAEILAARFGQGGVFFGLPTMATANPMFDRIVAWLGRAVGEDDASIALAHGKAGLNESYAGLLRHPQPGPVYDEEDAALGRAVVTAWLRGRKRAGLASFVVGTIDQGLFGALKAKHLALRHLGLAGKVVVIDEVHAADVYMRHYLGRLLTWLGAFQTPVILMSATLPPDQRDAYVRAYAEGRGDRTPALTDRLDTYPRLTSYPPSPVTLVDETRPSTIALHRIADDDEALADLLAEALAAGGCAGVLCNTVARAQQAYRVLRERFGDDVELAHSRFLAPDRTRREAALVRRLGREGDRPGRLIVVGTQVLEQSLDIDFDLLVTDLAPIDLLFQRIGRLHRHPRTRPERLTRPRVHLRGVEDWSAVPPRAVRGARTIYGEAPLLRAAAVLDGRDELIVPADIPALVRLGYDPQLAPPAGWESRWAAAAQAAVKADAVARDRAATFLLDSPLKPSNLNGWIDVQAPDPDRSEEQGRSQVRDSEDSLEVIALFTDAEGDLRLPDRLPRHAGALVPIQLVAGFGVDHDLARTMATCTLPLPVSMSRAGCAERVLTALERGVDCSGWQQSPWLAGQLVLAFDADGDARVDRFALHYDPDEGLTVIEEPE